MIRKVATELEDAVLLELDHKQDARGYFTRMFCAREFAGLGLPAQVQQANRSLSKAKHTLRGLHYKLPPYMAAKTIACTKGSLLDVFIDLRSGSPTYMRHCAVTLRANEGRMVHVPKGFAHGFMTLEDNTEVVYFEDEFYSERHDRGIRWDDPAFAIDWPATPAVISDRDASHPDYTPEAANAPTP